MAKKIKVHLSKHATCGSGYLSWERLEQRLIESGELMEQDKLRSIEVTKEGITYSTRKKRKNEE